MKIIDFIKRRYSPRGSYSSFTNTGEDLLLQQALLKFKLKKVNYIDIGCHHPIFGNITYLLYRNGGRGVLVEPNVNLSEIIKKKRSRDIYVQGCVGGHNGESKFYKFERSTRNTVMESSAKDWGNKSGQEYSTSVVPVYTLDSIIKKYNNDMVPDLISIDTEGYEEEILSGFQWIKKPKVFCIETAGRKEYFDNLLIKHGYDIFASTPANTIYINKLK